MSQGSAEVSKTKKDFVFFNKSRNPFPSIYGVFDYELTHEEAHDGDQDGQHVDGDLGVPVGAAGEKQLGCVVIITRTQGA